VKQDATLPDYLRQGLRLVFVGINPGTYSASAGHYYARRANKFWELLSNSGLVSRKVDCEDDARLPKWGIGLTDVVKRPTASANELTRGDYQNAAPALLRKLRRYQPRIVAFNGKTGYRNFRRALGYRWEGHVPLGKQREDLEGAEVFVLPSTSPANARLSPQQKLVFFRHLAERVRALSNGGE
jgi:double-stranded uracil-DNA glycosylase